ncbi:ATP-dependent DNA helicase RecG [Corynebacterium ciconiae DSM 44920]|uniref:ATP-dependent DNA helicase RecG n=1 Tax=Corynebacterium ciconiae TaxID=227319 RepID=UPI00037E7FA5|nr:ATP-dependent DNA helicase RecG [Corynebacterium ciconiae]WKD61069.1 ATP-dependent DNA helicase RecG [Corynebacterium ciconiae DSM 44920]
MLGWKDERRLSALLPAKEARAIREKLGLYTVTDLLEHFPRAWSRYGSDVLAESVEEGDVVTCVGTVVQANSRYLPAQPGKKPQRITRISVSDGRTLIGISFFNSHWLDSKLAVGTRAIFTGKVKYYRGRPQLTHPSFHTLPDPDSGEVPVSNMNDLKAYGDGEAIQQLFAAMDYLPVYPMRKGVTSWRFMAAVDRVLDALDPIPDPLGTPAPHGLPSLDEALRGIHQPDARGPMPFIQRLKYNEALTLALVMALRTADNEAKVAPSCPIDSAEVTDESSHGAPGQQQSSTSRRAQLVDRLPFALTAGQRAVQAEISADLARTQPMSRLLLGEVGSGKTVLALLGMLQVVDAGRQAVLLAPTEVLAVQHTRSLQALLDQAGMGGMGGVHITCLTGSAPTASKRQALLDIVSGEADIVVGTHALLQEGVDFFDLGLVVVDEQHRFGVEQRDKLRLARSDGKHAHMLVMTATPIPRTIAMTSFGDLEISMLRELPGGRRPISSSVVPESKPAWVQRAWERIREEAEQGRQCFVVCPRIEGDGGVYDMHEQLSAQIFPDLEVGMLHGKMDSAYKDRVMRDFAAGGIDVLVSTTVIEVGIDVPNATVMYVREADKFGVSQLHQLRGRVGRGSHPAVCLFHTSQPAASPSFERLRQVAETTDGFALAELDLRTRQEGDVLGTEQSGGRRRVKLLSLIDDGDMIEQANADALEYVRTNPEWARQLVSEVEEDTQEFIEKS